MINDKLNLLEVSRDMLFDKYEEKNFYRFLKKFDRLNDVKWTEQAIGTAIQQICWDLAIEKIKYCELKLSISRYMKDLELPPAEVIKIIYDIISYEEVKWSSTFSLVLCLKYESDRKEQLEIANVINDKAAVGMISGIDLVGDEAYFDAEFYRPIFEKYKEAGLGLEAHVGESQSVINVQQAIEVLHVDRIAHGIKAVDHPDILAMIKEHDICMDIAISSNIYTGVVQSIAEHPVKRLFDYGVDITIGTDDPIILNTSLNVEYNYLLQLGFTDSQIIKIMDNSIYHAFDKHVSVTSLRSQHTSGVSSVG